MSSGERKSINYGGLPPNMKEETFMYTIVPFRKPNDRMTAPFMTDRFFRSFFDMDDMVGSAGFRVDVSEDENAYRLEAELPGVSKDKINLTVDDDALVISADMGEEKKEKRGNYLYSERRTGHAERRFNLEGIDESAITADYRDGVLLVTLPKAKPEEKKAGRTIAIGSGEN